VTTNLALALAEDPSVQVGVLDVDICGPSQARMFGCEEESVHDSADGMTWVNRFRLVDLATNPFQVGLLYGFVTIWP